MKPLEGTFLPPIVRLTDARRKETDARARVDRLARQLEVARLKLAERTAACDAILAGVERGDVDA